nr:ABC transporter permease [Candidatus Acidoferrales bacterium]
MRDWKQFVREHLPPLGLSGAREQEIVEEIAQQIEDAHAEAISRGLTSEQSEAHAIAQIPNWNLLARDIQRAEQPIKTEITACVPQDWREAMHQENFRKRRGGNMFADLLQDIRYAFRMLRKSPGFTSIVVLTLALGIGATTAIFSAVYALLIRPLPYPGSSRLMEISQGWPKNNDYGGGLVSQDFVAARSSLKSFSSIAGYLYDSGTPWNYSGDQNLTGTGDPIRVKVVRITANFLPVLGVTPAQGRNFVSGEDREGGP